MGFYNRTDMAFINQSIINIFLIFSFQISSFPLVNFFIRIFEERVVGAWRIVCIGTYLHLAWRDID